MYVTLLCMFVTVINMATLGDKYFWRQGYIQLSGMLFALGVGVMLGFPFILNPYLLDEDSYIQASLEQINWMATSNRISAVIGFITQSPIMQIFGRKVAHIVLNTSLIVGWGIIMFSRSYDALYAATVIQGYAFGGLFVNTILVSEYCHPKRRGYFIALKEASRAIGLLICHCINSKFTFRQVSIFAGAPAILSVMMTLSWPESPAFLAMKGRFEECAESFKWIHGSTQESEIELEALMTAQKTRLEAKNKEELRNTCYKIIRKVLSKELQKAFVIVSVLAVVIEASGKSYFIPCIFKYLTESETILNSSNYNYVAIDLIIILALILSCFLMCFLKRRIILFTFGGFSILLMFCISFCKFYDNHNSFERHREVLSIILILLHLFSIYFSVVPVCFTYFGELFCLEHRGVGFCVSGVVWTCFYAFTMKFTPILLLKTGIKETYIMYGSVMSICFVVLYYILPETKDKSLQTIADEIKGISENIDEVRLDNIS